MESSGTEQVLTAQKIARLGALALGRRGPGGTPLPRILERIVIFRTTSLRTWGNPRTSVIFQMGN